MIHLHKQEKLSHFAKSIENKSLVFIDYRGIDVENMEGLRLEFRKENGKIKVIKNTFAKRALKNLDLEFDDSIFKGMIATTIVDHEQFISSGKSLLKAEKGNKIVIKGGLFEGEKLSPDEVRKYASLMSKEELYGALVGCLQGVVSNLVFVLQEVGSQKEQGASSTDVLEAEKKADLSGDQDQKKVMDQSHSTLSDSNEVKEKEGKAE